jgi:hypothetical protein
MVQVGCTNNYARRCLWKEIAESGCATFSPARVDYPGNVGENDSALPSIPIHRASAFLPNRGPVAQLGARFHGMEEVVGSIPTRSTNSLNNLDGASARNHGVCVMLCVITRRSSAHGKGFHRCPLRFHPHVAVPLQHATADVPSNRHDR